MIHLTKLLHGGTFSGDPARFPGAGAAVSPPVVVWHMTGACNLRCKHCYALADASNLRTMSRGEVIDFLDRLAVIRPHSLLLSGGEPLAHPDFFEIVDRAVSLGLHVSLSTNGTLIDAGAARFLKNRGVGYVGVSLDGTGRIHDDFRGINGAFIKAVEGICALRNAGCRVGLRFTMARPLLPNVFDIMNLAQELAVDRACFYHFVPAGRGRSETSFVPPRPEIREVLEALFEWVERADGVPEEVLTVGSFSDGLLLYLRLLERGDARAENVLALISRVGGARSGRGIVSVRWDGSLFADQFSWHRPLGRWTDLGRLPPAAPDLPKFGGRCGVCRWLSLCRGNLRARAEAMTGDVLGEDSGCALTDEETVHDFGEPVMPS